MTNLVRINAATAALLGVSALGAMTAAERSKGRYMRDGTGHPNGGASLTPEQVVERFKSSLDEVRTLAEKATTEVKNLGTLSAETKESADKALVKFNVVDELKARLDTLEQKSDRPGGTGHQVKTYGAQVHESPEFKSFMERGGQGSMRLSLKAITSATGEAGGLIVSQRETEVVGLPTRPDLVMRDLVTVMPISTSSVDYPKQTVRQNAAAPVPEGTQKPYSNYGWARATAPVRTIAHLAKLTRQALDDADRLQAEVDAEMRYGLALAEDAQILLGDGTGENLLGLMPQATPYAAPAGITNADPDQIDKLRFALLQASLGLYPADAMVLHQVDWANIETTKDTQGRYIFANPTASAGPTLWAKPVVPTQSMAVGSFLVGAFKVAATLYDRLTPEVLISSENANDFELNLLTMRCEERIALAVKRPAALIKGQFAN